MNLRKYLTFIYILFSLSSFAQSSVFEAGQTYLGTNDYVEYRAGSLPIILTAPHGGLLKPASIPDRDCSGCVTSADLNTQYLARQLDSALYDIYGCHPHMIINRLHRSKLDANRDIVEAADGNPTTEVSWNEYQAYIQAAIDSITKHYGKGILIDLHGHGHDIDRLELGYYITKTELQLSDATLNGNTYRDKSTIKNLAKNHPLSFSFIELLRGVTSFGGFFERAGYPSVPSPVAPAPLGSEEYFRGGYTVQTYGSKDGGVIDALQIECHKPGLRDTYANRRAFCLQTAPIIRSYLELHYFNTPFVFGACDGRLTLQEDESDYVIQFAVADENDNGGFDIQSLTLLQESSSGGSASGTVQGTITYTPAPDFYGTDTLVYRICDTLGTYVDCYEDSLFIEVTPVDDDPVAQPDSMTLLEDAPSFTWDVLSNDLDVDGNLNLNSLDVISHSLTEASLSIANGKFTYQPPLNYFGKDSIQYKVCDLTARCDTAWAILNITAQNDAPVALSDTVVLAQDTTDAVLTVLMNDSDVESDLTQGTLSILTPLTQGGTVAIISQNQFEYDAPLGYFGTDSLHYKICDDDQDALCDSAWLHITLEREEISLSSPEEHKPTFTLYPTNQGYTLDAPTATAYTLYNSLGQIVEQEKLLSNQTTILQEEKTGVYLLELQLNNGSKELIKLKF